MCASGPSGQWAALFAVQSGGALPVARAVAVVSALGLGRGLVAQSEAGPGWVPADFGFGRGAGDAGALAYGTIRGSEGRGSKLRVGMEGPRHVRAAERSERDPGAAWVDWMGKLEIRFDELAT